MAATTKTGDEFTVEEKCICKIQNNEEKLDRLFNVKVIYLTKNNNQSKSNDFEWLRLEGEDEDDCRNAKEYIIALTKPLESKVLHFPVEMYDFGNDLFLELIEKQTRAHIEQFGSGSVRIHGTSLSVTLALSIIEDKINNFINRKKTQSNCVNSKADSNGLVGLKERSAAHKSFNNYNSKKTTQTPCGMQGKHPVLENFSHNNSESSTQDSMNNLLSLLPQSHLHNGKINPNPSSINTRYSDTRGLENACGHSDKEYLPGSIGDPASGEISLEGCQLSLERITFFTNLAKQIGHVPTDIQEALKMAADDMKPSHFIRLLNNIKEEREIVEKEEGENDQNDESKLPMKYIELLLNDFKEEAGISSIEELKRRNQARQQCLQQHTQNSNKNSPQDFFPQTGWDSTKKKKTKKKTVRMPDIATAMTPGSYTAENNGASQINLDKVSNVGLGHENGGNKVLHDRITSSSSSHHHHHHQSYKSALTGSCEPEEINSSKLVPFQRQQPTLLKPTNGPLPPSSSYIYLDKRHSENDLRTSCIINKTDEHHYHQPHHHHHHYSSTNSGHLEKTESNSFLTQMDLEKTDSSNNDDLRYIVIDGSNIAMAHGNGKFSCKGIQIAVNYFVQRGHNVMVFVPQHKLCAPGPNNIILDQDILYLLKEKGHLAFTPSRKLQGKLINCYDDRFILSLAEREDGIIVSNDQYRDLMQEKASWKEIVEKRLLMYTFVKDNFMLPEDPLGRDGPMLDEFLRKRTKDGNCTPKKSIRPTYRPPFVPAQRPLPQAQPNYQILQRGRPRTRPGNPPTNNIHSDSSIRSPEESRELYLELKALLPEREQEEILKRVLIDNPSERDISRLCNSCIQMIFGN